MAWLTDDIADMAAMLAAASQMRAAAKQITEAVGRIRDRHRLDATAPVLLREQHIEEEARHVAHEADDIERDAEIVHRMFEGGAA